MKTLYYSHKHGQLTIGNLGDSCFGWWRTYFYASRSNAQGLLSFFGYGIYFIYYWK